MGKAGGYTVVELLTVLALVSIALALAYPSLAALTRGQELERAAVDLLYGLRLASAKAVVAGCRMRVSTAPGGDGRWRYLIEREAGEGWAAEGVARAVPRGAVLATAGPPVKLFNPDGTCSSGSYALRGTGGELYRYTLSPATGRVRFYRGDREAARGG